MSITLIDVRNPQWVQMKQDKLDSEGKPVLDSEGNHIIENAVDSNGDLLKGIECQTKWSHIGDNSQEWSNFFVTPHDTTEHGKKLWEDLKAGNHGAIADE